MDKPAYINILISLSTSAVCTTAIVDKVVFGPLIDNAFDNEDFERSILAHTLFFVIDTICAIIMLAIDAESLVPFLFLLVLLMFTAVAFYYNRLITRSMETLDLYNKLRTTNMIRVFLSFGRFVCLFGYSINVLYRDT